MILLLLFAIITNYRYIAENSKANLKGANNEHCIKMLGSNDIKK